MIGVTSGGVSPGEQKRILSKGRVGTSQVHILVRVLVLLEIELVCCSGSPRARAPRINERDLSYILLPRSSYHWTQHSAKEGVRVFSHLAATGYWGKGGISVR